MKSHIVGIVLGILFGFPAIAAGSSFTYSLVQGKTPGEAFGVVGDQVSSLFGRVESVEQEQESLSERLDVLEDKVEPSIDPALDERRKPEPVEEEVPIVRALNSETQEICDKYLSQEANKNSLKGNIQTLCNRVAGEALTQERFDSFINKIHDLSDMSSKTE